MSVSGNTKAALLDTGAVKSRDGPGIDHDGAMEVPPVTEHAEPAAHGHGLSGRLNWLRAGVLGANDGIVSVAGVVMGVAGATTDRTAILIAGIAALVAGALSMATGEYVSVATQLTEGNALRAHAVLELGLDPDELTNPLAAAGASMLAFTVGATLPALTILLPDPQRFVVTALAVLIALAFTGYASARLGYAGPGRAVLRNMVGGGFAMGITYLVGTVVGAGVS
jgi:VIT1/CCC1 family predicted Fe2+/Mn2+ transporter